MSFSQHSLNLEVVIRHFAEWRYNRPNARSRIPEELWKEASQLCESYPISHVSRSLGLNSHCLNQKRNHFRSCVGFVEVNLNPASSLLTPPVSLELERPDGMKLHLNDVSDQGFHHLLERFFTGGSHATDRGWQ